MNHMNNQYYNSPAGWLEVVATKEGISDINFKEEEAPSNPSEMTNTCVEQLKEFFAGKRETFDLPLAFAIGTPFERSVWEELLKIPIGKTTTYLYVTKQIGKTRAATRAVGRAIGKNPIPIVVPCHRVVGANGSLTGFASGLARKEILLKAENSDYYKTRLF